MNQPRHQPLAPPPIWPVPDEDIRLAFAQLWADGSWGRYAGRHQQRLLELLAEMHQLPYVQACCSGTIAVELALRGLQIGPGAEVLLAAYDFSGNFRAIEAVGAQPVLIDIGPDHWCLDAELVRGAQSPPLRAVIVSHLHGTHADMRQLMELAQQYQFAVIEDACQCPGALVQGRTAGTWGDVSVLSFGGSKLLSSGRGGAVLTRRADVYQRIKVHCERGNDAFPLSEMQAAVLPPQLAKLATRNEHRRANVERLLERLSNLAALRPLRATRPGDLPSYYKLAFLYDADRAGGVTRERVIAALQAAGVPCDSGFRGFARRSSKRCRQASSLENSRRAAEQAVLLHHPILLEPPESMDALADAIRSVLVS